MRALKVCCFLILVICSAQAQTPQPTPSTTPKPAPDIGGRGTVDFWLQQLKGKTKPEIKAELGTPSAIKDKGAVYVYKDELFHPDLDRWRDLLIRFSEKDDFAESFTGSGGDTKIYKIGAPLADEVAPPTPTPTPSPSPDARASDARIKEITDKVEASVVTMEMTEPAVALNATDSGTGGTGFVVERDGKKYVASNIHVLEGEAMQEIRLAWHHGPRPGKVNSPREPHKARVRSSFDKFLQDMLALPQQRIKSVAGESLSAGNRLLLSDTRDIAFVPVVTEIDPLTVSTTPPKREQTVVVVGNADATHTLQVVQGEVEQIGPDRFEIGRVRDGELQPGMSGSPVVDVATGEVLGVFAYSKGGRRFFAYRIDNLADLRAVPWSDFVRDCAIMTAFKERVLNVNWASNAYAVVAKNDPVHELTPDFNDHVQIAYASFVRDMKRIFETSDKVYRIDRWQEYQRKLENLMQAGLEEDKYLVFTPYIKREMDTILADERSKVIEALRTAANKVQ